MLTNNQGTRLCCEMRWDNHTRGDGAGEHPAMSGRMSWVGFERDNTDIIPKRSFHQSDLLHRAGEAPDEGGETGTGQV